MSNIPAPDHPWRNSKSRHSKKPQPWKKTSPPHAKQLTTKETEMKPIPSNSWNAALRRMMGWEETPEYQNLIASHDTSCRLCKEFTPEAREEVEQRWIFGEDSSAIGADVGISHVFLRRHFVAKGLHWLRISMRWLIRAEMIGDPDMRKADVLDLMRDMDKAEGIGQPPMIQMMAAMTQKTSDGTEQQAMIDVSGMSDEALQEFMRIYRGEELE